MHIKHLMHTFSHLHLAVVDKHLHMKLYLHILIGVYIWVVTVQWTASTLQFGMLFSVARFTDAVLPVACLIC